MYNKLGTTFSKQRRIVEEMIDAGEEFEIRANPKTPTGRVY